MKRTAYITASRMLLLISALSAPQAAVMADEYWDQKTSLFELLPVGENDIVFLGNSITDGGEFHELFGMDNIKNRGIRSDLITGVEKRIGQITAGSPKKIFLLIGINDISHGHSAETLGKRYERLVRKIREESPKTRLYLQSVMPVNNSLKRYKNLQGKERTIRELNAIIEKIASENDAVYVDLWPFLADSNGNLDLGLTNDGLHLNGRGYRVWTKGIMDLVKE
ncbi:MAG: hypothetical protein K2L59_06705 [Muribaculaceae bacterium]|nr:hypothetical protein [Muribaculaceae bacterium]